MSRPARPLLALLAASFLVACGGQLAPVVTDLPFAPEQRTSGYGYTGGMHVTLVDPHTDGVQRTLRVDASQLSGTFDVANGAAKVTLTETGAPGGTKAFGGVSGVVVIDPIATGAGAGPRRSPFTSTCSCPIPPAPATSSTSRATSRPSSRTWASARARACARARNRK